MTTGLVSIHSPNPPEDVEVVNDGWFPNISLHAVRLAERITDTITKERLTWAVANAVLTVNSDLDAFKQAHIAAGRANLAAVPSPQINGQTRLTQLYLRAVYSLTHADLIERYPDYSMTPAGAKRAEELAPAGDDHYRNGRWAVRDILGLSRTTVELI